MITVAILKIWRETWWKTITKRKLDGTPIEVFAVGTADLVMVDHEISVGTTDGRRCFAFGTTEQRDLFLAQHPDAEPCLVEA